MKKHNKIIITDKLGNIVQSVIVIDGDISALKNIYPKRFGYAWRVTEDIYGKKPRLTKHQADFGACGSGICAMRDF